MAFYPDLATETQPAHAPHVRAVGWLSAEHAFSTGKSSLAFIERLTEYVARCDDSTVALGFPDLMGGHTCELCSNVDGYQNFGVPANGVLFVAPEMIHHYVTRHSYAPPAAFVNAVLLAPLPGTNAYLLLAKAFPPSSTCVREERA